MDLLHYRHVAEPRYSMLLAQMRGNSLLYAQPTTYLGIVALVKSFRPSCLGWCFHGALVLAWPSLKRAEANLLRACDDIGICSMGLRALSEYWRLLASAMETDWKAEPPRSLSRCRLLAESLVDLRPQPLVR